MGVGARLRARWYLVALAIIVAILVAGASLYHLGSGGLVKKESVYHVGSAQLLVDTDPSALTTVGGSASQGLGARAPYIAEYATSSAITAAISKSFGHPVKVQAVVKASALGGASSASNSPGANPTTGAGNDSVVLQATGAAPTIQITTQAGSLPAARALAVATVTNLRQSLGRLQKAQAAAIARQDKAAASTTSTTKGKAGTTTTPATTTTQKASAPVKIILRTLGSITAANAVSTPKKSKAILYGVGALVLLLLVILAIDSALDGTRRRQRGAATASPLPMGASGGPAQADSGRLPDDGQASPRAPDTVATQPRPE